MQTVYTDFSALDIIADRKPLLVCDNAYELFGIDMPAKTVRFSGFKPNPLFEDARTGAQLLKKNNCDFIVAIGGGSAIDTAKCIKYFCGAEIPLMAVPTTSGTGSEATHFAAIYKDSEKRSISEAWLLPDYVILQPKLLESLPIYQKKCTMLDALCQSIESWWSRKSTPESIELSKNAIRLIMDNMGGYLRNEHEGNKNMLAASNTAGRAINITTTTAPHAMSYKLTTLYGLPHGHSVALCLPKVWRQMGGYDDIAKALYKNSYTEAIVYLEDLLCELEIYPPQNVGAGDIKILTDSVNEERLGNHPISLSKEVISEIYAQILSPHQARTSSVSAKAKRLEYELDNVEKWR